jgi:hypothetical protein
MKIVLNSWFRSDSAHTSNGIVDFMRQMLAAKKTHTKKQKSIEKNDFHYQNKKSNLPKTKKI